ncbi:MAG: multidrug efflux MFS transporter [Scardovia wiggsiae]|nr:multidrug efflux MFS transporter [Scardovia wiggsiae]
MAAQKGRTKFSVRRLGRSLSDKETYSNGPLTHEAFISLAVLTAITFLGNFTQLQLSSALPTMVHEFHISVTTGQWMTSVFQLVMGVMVPLTAFLTRRFTTRQIVLASMAIFIAGSILAWAGPTFAAVLSGRILEAIGTGVLWPVLQIAVFSVIPMSRRGVAMGTVGMAMSVAPALGPTLGGLQTDNSGWRSIFFTLAAAGIIAFILAFVWLRNFSDNDASAKTDFFSVMLSVFGFGGLMFGFTNIEAYPPSHPQVWIPAGIGVIGIIWFIARQLHAAKKYKQAVAAGEPAEEDAVSAGLSGAAGAAADVTGKAGTAAGHSTNPGIPRNNTVQPPLLDLSVLKNRSFCVGTIVAALSFFAFSSITVIIPLYIQDDRGFTATMSGLIMLPGALGQCIAQFFGGRLLDRFGARPVALLGIGILCIGTVMMSMIDLRTGIWWVSVCQFIRQIGMGFTLMPVTTWSLNCLEPQEVSAGSAVTNTARQIAGAVGAPVLVILMDIVAKARFAFLSGSAPAQSLRIISSIFAVKWVLRISAVIAFIMVMLVLFGIKGSGAGSSHDVAHRAIARMNRELAKHHLPVLHTM